VLKTLQTLLVISPDNGYQQLLSGDDQVIFTNISWCNSVLVCKKG